MSRYSSCPYCGNEASGGLFGGVYIPLHKCRSCGQICCNGRQCSRNASQCPKCGSNNLWTNYDEAYTRR